MLLLGKPAAAGLPQQLGEAGFAAAEGWDADGPGDDLGGSNVLGRALWHQNIRLWPNLGGASSFGGFMWVRTSNGLTALCLVQVHGRPSVQDW